MQLHLRSVLGASPETNCHPSRKDSMQRTLVVIPARMQSTRLPDKPLADIGGTPMIVHVWRRAMAAEVGRVVVATDNEADRGGGARGGRRSVMTRADHASGSDRVFEAVNQGRSRGRVRVHPQPAGRSAGDGAARSRATASPRCSTRGPHIATIAAEITDEADRTNSNVGEGGGHADWRAAPAAGSLLHACHGAPWGEGPLYHHFGMYAYRRAALERFVSLKPSPLEKRERLEQLRALEDGMRIDVTLVDTVPVEVNTPEDLELARRLLAG